jgi:hypothetical protein
LLRRIPPRSGARWAKRICALRCHGSESNLVSARAARGRQYEWGTPWFCSRCRCLECTSTPTWTKTAAMLPRSTYMTRLR